MSKLICVEGISKEYGKKIALQSLSFDLKKGEVLALLGPNGSGKSTTLQILLGLRSSPQGSVQLQSHPGYVGQDLSFPSNLKCHEVLHLVQSHFQEQDKIPLEDLKKEFQLDDFWCHYAGELSGGQKRRLALACAMSHSPDILILDEPTTGLDLEGKIQLWNWIKKFRDQGGGVLLCTHDLLEVQKLADRTLVLQNGKKIFYGPMQEILAVININHIRLQCEKNQALLLKDFHGVREVKISDLSPADISNEEISFNGSSSSAVCVDVLCLDSDEFIKSLVERQIIFRNLTLSKGSLEQALSEIQNQNLKSREKYENS